MVAWLLLLLRICSDLFLTGMFGNELDGFLNDAVIIMLPWLWDSNLSLSDITWLICCEEEAAPLLFTTDEHTEIDDLGDIDADDEEDDEEETIDTLLLVLLTFGFTEYDWFSTSRWWW